MEALELFWFVARHKTLFSRVQSHYDKIVFAVGLLILVTLIAAGFAVYDAAPKVTEQGAHTISQTT